MQKSELPTLRRRAFLKRGSLLGAGLSCGALPFFTSSARANEKFVVGVMGLGRGLDLVKNCFALPGVEVAHVCDVDRQRVERASKAVREHQSRPAQGSQDFRRMLDDGAIDLVLIATCNHWHAPATILACAAGKHVYVEKPGSQNPHEGELMVAAARKHRRVVQMGNQRRTWPGIVEAIEKLRSGAIGAVRYARCWYDNRRAGIGRGKAAPVPAHLDYSLWQGPAPERPYKSNLIHYNWHWHWHWGNGELGNNGIHALDIARWGLGVDYPRRVSYTGGRYHHDDDQETPDTGAALFDFGDVGASWEGSSCHPRRQEDHAFVAFYGDGGTLEIRGAGYRIHDLDGKVTAEASGKRHDPEHIADLLEAIRGGKQPASEIEDAQRSTLLCHLGNIAYRTGRTIQFDAAQRRIAGDAAAASLWSREYRDGWEPKV